MVMCLSKSASTKFPLDYKQNMFQANGLAFESQQNNLLVPHVKLESSMATSPTEASTAPLVNSSIRIENPSIESSNSTPNTGSTLQDTYQHLSSNPTNTSNTNISSGESSGIHCPIPSSPLQQSHPNLISMYSNVNYINCQSNTPPSSLMMTPPSSYSNETAIMGTDNSLMQHSWYSPLPRQHHSPYSELTDWPSSAAMCSNSSFSSSSNVSLPCTYQMPFASPYGTIYNPCRGSTAHPVDLYDNRFNAPYPFYPNPPLLNSSSSTAPASHSFSSFSVGADMSQMQFGHNMILNSSPDSGGTVTTEGNDSPMHNSPNTDSNILMNIGPNLSRTNNGVTEEDMKNIALHTSTHNNQQQEATSTTPNTAMNGDTNSNSQDYNWLKSKSGSMGYPHSNSGKTRTKDKYRVVYTENQRVELEKEFLFSRYITIKRKSELAQQLSLSERQVKIWFQNRRAKDRKQNRKKDEQKKDANKEVTMSDVALLSNTPNADMARILMPNNGVNSIHHMTPNHSMPHSYTNTHHGPLNSPTNSEYRDLMIGQMQSTTPTVVNEINVH